MDSQYQYNYNYSFESSYCSSLKDRGDSESEIIITQTLSKRRGRPPKALKKGNRGRPKKASQDTNQKIEVQDPPKALVQKKRGRPTKRKEGNFQCRNATSSKDNANSDDLYSLVGKRRTRGGRQVD